MAQNEAPSPPEDIGRSIIQWALRAITVIAVVALLVAAIEPTNRAANVKDILALLLPVIGAWVGTVLAFYFGRENYAAAAKSTEKLLALTLEQKLEATKASEAMRPIGKIVAIRADDDAKIKLKDDATKEGMLDKMSDAKSRLPVFNSQGVARYIVHRSMIDRFIAERALEGKSIADLSLADLVGDADIKAMITSFGVIGADDSLALAKHKIDADPKCLDVFVTEGGDRTKPVLGWITNNTVLELAKA